MKFQLGRNDANVLRYIKAKKEYVPKLMRMFMVEFYRQVTISTPVDTGRARWGWNCSIRQPDMTNPPEGKYTLDARRAIETFSISAVTGKDTLYVTNAVPYIGKLNEGWSRQAPARFVELSFETAFNKLRKYIQVQGYQADT